MNKQVLTEKELASELGLSPWTVRRMRLSEGCPCFRIGNRIFFRLESVLSWIAEREQGKPEPAKPYGVLRRID